MSIPIARSVGWATLALSFIVTPAFTQIVDPKLWGTNGNVAAITRSGNTIFVGGAFTLVGPNSGGGVPLDRRTGQPIAGYPKVAGVVQVVTADGAGGWYVGGSFVAVGGLPRANLAHILADGRVAAWAPDPDDQVTALVLSGNTLYVGGFFTHIGGRERRYVAALDVGSGTVKDWDPEADRQVRTILLHQGRLYAGGNFSTIGGQVRHSVAELDPASGEATPWNPDLGGTIRALAAMNDTIYVGGGFGSPRANYRTLASVSALTGSVLAWSPVITGPDDIYYGDPYVNVLAVRGGTIYVGGHFTGVGGEVRGGLAEVNRATGEPTGWSPDVGPWFGALGPDVITMSMTESTLYFGGYLESAMGQPRNYVAEAEISTGNPTEWNPNANGAVMALAVAGSRVFVGGRFTGLGSNWTRRMGLAAFDATTGAVKEWDPDPDGLIIYALAVYHGQVYIGGYFSHIGGQERWGLAAVDTVTGMATGWNPTANSVVSSLAVVGDTLFAGGYFTTMSDQPRGHLAAFDLVAGELIDWNPNASSDVYGLVVRENTVFVTGFFWMMGDVPRVGLAALDRRSGAVLKWYPEVQYWANSIAIVGDTVFVGGRFDVIGGQPRSNLAAVDANTGRVLDWTANASSTVGTLLVVGDTLLVGGGFYTIGGQTRRGLAALDRSTGAVLPWDPGLDSDVLTLVMADHTVYVGGGFHRINGIPAASIAGLSFGPPAPPPPNPPSRTMLSWLAPNPVENIATVRFAVPVASEVTLSVFDIQGRRVASILDRDERSAGIHEAPLRTDGWTEGCYFLRLEAAGMVDVMKFLVLR